MADRIGQQLGNYRVLSFIGHGGFADVYLGEHIYLKTQVAIKLLQSKVATPDDLDNFLKEAQTIAHLIHPNIVRVTDFGVDNETPFLVMDYAANGTLRQRHPRGSILPLPTIVSYVKQVAAALQHAHDEKLIHRDIKPENMLLGRKNEVLLSDFGIALIAQSSRYQSTQDVVGTVAYMSPEQIQGKPRPASDQYSLAVVVYEWLTGDRPFHGSFTELCTQHMFAPPPPLRERIPTISPDVEHVVSTALAKEPRQRFGSVQAFANALEQASQHNVRSSRPLPASQPLQEVPPTQAVAPPQLAPTSLANTSSIPIPPPPPSMSGGFSTSQPGSVSTYPPQSGAISPTSTGTGKRKFLALIVGLLLYGIPYALTDIPLQNYSPNNPLFNPIIPTMTGPFSYSFDYYALLSGLIFTVPLFFSIEFGLVVGSIIAVLGAIIGDYLVFHILSPWYFYLSYGVLGFIPGFFRAIAGNRNRRVIGTGTAIVWGAVALIVSNIVATIGNNVTNHYTGFDFGGFFGGLLANAICLILLPIALKMYNSRARKNNALS